MWPTKMETKNKQQVKLMLKSSFIIYIWAFRLPVCMASINKRKKKRKISIRDIMFTFRAFQSDATHTRAQQQIHEMESFNCS